MQRQRRDDICATAVGSTRGQHQHGPGIAHIAAGQDGLPALAEVVAQAALVYCDASTLSHAPNVRSSASATCGINYSDGSVWRQKVIVVFDNHGRPVADWADQGTEVLLPAAGQL